MNLAILDPHGNVLLSWPTVESAHGDLGDMFAARLAPHRWQARKRKRTARKIIEHVLELQHETVRL